MLLVIILIVLIFGLLVFVHELGHFVAAKRGGVNVEEFGFGFPPRLIGKEVGGTVYSLNLIPLGGFVKLQGEDLHDQTPGSFGAASFSRKSAILLAGVSMNALAAFIILVSLCLTGLPPIIANQFSSGQASYVQPKQDMVVNVVKRSPAEQAGIVRGDLILKGNTQNFNDEQQLLDFTKAHAGQNVWLTVNHHGSTSKTLVHLRPAGAKDGYLGVTPFQTYKLHYDLPHALVTAGGILLQLMWATLGAFGGLVVSLFVHGKVSDQVAGPVGIVVLLGNIISLGLAYVLIFVASISISLAVINALPLPALDGGRWALVLAQRLTGKQLSQRTEGLVHTIGFVALILLMVVVTIFDIKRFG
jgi:regulator of sigma E protease